MLARMSRKKRTIDDEISRLEAQLADLDEEEKLVSLEDERIPPLPPSQLPAPPRAKKAKSSGALLSAAKKLVEDAVASEKVKIPFACRLCAFRGSSLDELEIHRKSPLHRMASKLYREESYCKLCRVQCTSPLELKTHTVSKKHRERLLQTESFKRPPPR